MKSTMLDAKPTHRHLPRHPQENGNSAQIAAAACGGFILKMVGGAQVNMFLVAAVLLVLGAVAVRFVKTK
jgi:hypothetical protein